MIANRNIENLMREIIDHYGPEHQKIVAIEELGELIQAITKDLRGMPNMYNIIEELADVRTMLDQLTLIYDTYDQELDIRARKLIRQIDRMKREKENEESQS